MTRNRFYDRSLGVISNAADVGKPYQVVAATNQAIAGPAQRRGQLAGKYDEAGQLTRLLVVRRGPCLPSGAKCSHYFAYEWDEVGRLADARRWDLDADSASQLTAGSPLPAGDPAAHLRYAYDANDERVVKTAMDSGGAADRHAVFVFSTLELRGSHFTGGDYERTALTEVPYLFSHDVRIARVAFEPPGVPSLDAGRSHVFFELGDHLGSNGVVLDKATSELVERDTYEAYGATDSDYRPERWSGFRESYRFTGKEDDVELGLVYFGKRYYAPGIGIWVSADPLVVHAPTNGDPNLYAYVTGRPLTAIDKVGLDPASHIAYQLAQRPLYMSKEEIREQDKLIAKYTGIAVAAYLCGRSPTCAKVMLGVALSQAKTEGEAGFAILLGLPGLGPLKPGIRTLTTEAEVTAQELKAAEGLAAREAQATEGAAGELSAATKPPEFVGPPRPPEFVGPPAPKPPMLEGESVALVPYLQGPNALRRAAMMAHNLAGNVMRAIRQSAVAVAKVRLPDGRTTYYAAGSGGRLNPAQRNLLKTLGVPEENILYGRAYTKGFSRAENHAERIMEETLPEGSEVSEWGISWAGKPETDLLSAVQGACPQGRGRPTARGVGGGCGARHRRIHRLAGAETRGGGPGTPRGLCGMVRRSPFWRIRTPPHDTDGS